MPVPVLLGLPWLFGALAGMFTAIFTWFINFAAKRLLIVVSAIVVLGGITSVFYLAIEGVLNTVTLALPSELTQAAGLFMPSNATVCVSAIASAHLLRWVYIWQIKIMQYKIGS